MQVAIVFQQHSTRFRAGGIVRKTIQQTVLVQGRKLLAIAALSLSLHGVILGQPPTHGKVEGTTYVDQRFGLRYTFPKNLDVQASLNGMPIGTGEKKGTSEFLFNAMEKPNGHIRKGVFITADPVGTYGATESSGFLKKRIAITLTPRDPPDITKVTIAGNTFSESKLDGNLAGLEANATLYTAQLATVCNGYFLAFNFSAPSPDDLTELLHSMDHMELNCSAASK
jgi:hypothetical protein